MELKKVVQYIVRGIRDQVNNCVDLNLHCLDPPSITSGLLDSYGLRSYSAKAGFWRGVDLLISRYSPLHIFKSRFGNFYLVLNHTIEEVYRVEGAEAYVDRLDCDYVECTTIPRSHVMRTYLEGYYDNRVVLRMNLVCVLKIALSENPYFRRCLDSFAENPFSPTSMCNIAKCVLALLYKHRTLYALLFRKELKSFAEVARFSPLLKRILSVAS